MLTADKTRILVTGGAGFVGANLVRMLPRQDFEVTVLDDLSEGKREYLTGLPIDFTKGNILDGAACWRHPTLRLASTGSS